eukprot:jgi/Bigna1/131416/aug1.14_g6124
MFQIFNDFGNGGDAADDPSLDKENATVPRLSYSESKDFRRTQKPKATSSKSRIESVSGYDPSILTALGRETSFEEYRAMIYWQKKRVKANYWRKKRAEITPGERKIETTPVRAKPAENPGDVASVEPMYIPSPAPAQGPPSPTIHTKEAMSDVLAMFKDDTADHSTPAHHAEVPGSGERAETGASPGFSIFCDFENEGGGAGDNHISDQSSFPVSHQFDPSDKKLFNAEIEDQRSRGHNSIHSLSPLQCVPPEEGSSGLAPILETSQEHAAANAFSPSPVGSTGMERKTKPTLIPIAEGATVDPFDDKARNTFLAAAADLKSQINGVSFKNIHNQACDFEFEDVVNGTETMVDLEELSLDIALKLHKIGTIQRFKALDMDSDTNAMVELAIASPPNLWPLHVTRKLLSAGLLNKGKFILVSSSFLFKGLSACVLPVCEESTMHDVLRMSKKTQKPLAENVVLYFAIEMLYAVSSLHNSRMIHGRLSPKSFHIALHQITELPPWNRSHKGGWAERGLILSELHDAIDIDMYSDRVQFRCYPDSKRVTIPCLEMKAGKPFTFQLDTYALGDIVHRLLYAGEKLKPIRQDCSGAWKRSTRASFKRSKVWDDFFDIILNEKEVSLEALVGNLEDALEKPQSADKLRLQLVNVSAELHAFSQSNKV